jgi:hypothetical protein
MKTSKIARMLVSQQHKTTCFSLGLKYHQNQFLDMQWKKKKRTISSTAEKEPTWPTQQIVARSCGTKQRLYLSLRDLCVCKNWNYSKMVSKQMVLTIREAAAETSSGVLPCALILAGDAWFSLPEELRNRNTHICYVRI